MNNELIKDINDVFCVKARLLIMTLLINEKAIDFKYIKNTLGLTDGNLGAHMKVLEKNDYIKVVKRYVNNRPNTLYIITTKGKHEFIKHKNQLKKIIQVIEYSS